MCYNNYYNYSTPSPTKCKKRSVESHSKHVHKMKWVELEIDSDRRKLRGPSTIAGRTGLVLKVRKHYNANVISVC